VDPEQDLIRVTVDPTGRFLFVLDGRVNLGNTGIIHMLQIDSDGIPGGAVFNTPSGGFNPEAFVIAPNGRFLYVANSYGDRITVFELDRDFGILTQKYSYTGYDRPTNMVLHPDGFSLYVVLENEESVARFRVEENGALSSLSEYQTATPEDTLEIALHPNRDRLYLTSYDGTIATFQVTAVGTLTYQGQVDIGLTHALAITPDGMNLYGTTSQMIREFSLDATSGMPTLDGVLDVPGQAAHARPTLR
ncbi:MAG: beta-propeller fold lactonase family protein, partial [Planctomycetota bacterium]